jgi:CDP-4-dehydro-6-deoxyglucose reductase, E3
MALETWQARLLEYRELADDVRHFVFEVEGVDQLEFPAGQFVSFTEELEGKKITRAYSIVSPPSGNRIELCLNRVQEGAFSPFLFSLEPGAVVPMKGPLGGFIMRNPINDSVFVATGTGIAPIRAMLMEILPKDREHSFTLLFGVRCEHTILYREDFERLQLEYPNFHFWVTLTRPPEGWAGRVGRVQDHLFEAIGPRRDMDIYICGLKAMVDDVRSRLKEAGFERRHLIYEKYD